MTSRKRPGSAQSPTHGRKKARTTDPPARASKSAPKGKKRTLPLAAETPPGRIFPKYTVIEEHSTYDMEEPSRHKVGTYDSLDAANEAAKKASEGFDQWPDYKEGRNIDGCLELSATVESDRLKVYVRPRGATTRPPVFVVIVRDTLDGPPRFHNIHLRLRSANLAVQKHALRFENAELTADKREWKTATVGKVVVAEIQSEYIYDLPNGLEEDESYRRWLKNDSDFGEHHSGEDSDSDDWSDDPDNVAY